MNKNILRNVIAVVVGFFAVAILSVFTDFVLEKFVTTINLVFALFYRSVYTIIGGYIAAHLSSTNPMRQVYVVAIVGFVAGSLGAYVNWELAAGAEWYPVLLAITGPIFVWLGGYLYIKNK